MKIRVIASDFDGTILKDGAQKVDDIYFPLIRALKEKGISFIAASGRQYGNLRRLLGPVAEEIGYICENGALIAQGSEVLCEREIDRRLVFSLIEDAKEADGARILLSCAGTSCVLPTDPDFVTLLKEKVKNTVTVYESFQHITEPVIKMALYWPEGIPKWWESRFQERYAGVLSVADGGGGWLDFTGRGVDNGKRARLAGAEAGICAGGGAELRGQRKRYRHAAGGGRQLCDEHGEAGGEGLRGQGMYAGERCAEGCP